MAVFQTLLGLGAGRKPTSAGHRTRRKNRCPISFDEAFLSNARACQTLRLRPSATFPVASFYDIALRVFEESRLRVGRPPDSKKKIPWFKILHRSHLLAGFQPA